MCNSLKLNKIPAVTIERILAGIGLIFGSVGVFVVARFNPSTSNFFPVCPLHALTGYSCPGCGLTRGFHSLFHGDIVSALMFNVMLPIYLIIFIYIGISFLFVVTRGRGLNFLAFSPRMVYAFFMLSLVFAILRNLPFYPFSLFSQ
jgi:hypothetical protein